MKKLHFDFIDTFGPEDNRCSVAKDFEGNYLATITRMTFSDGDACFIGKIGDKSFRGEDWDTVEFWLNYEYNRDIFKGK